MRKRKFSEEGIFLILDTIANFNQPRSLMPLNITQHAHLLKGKKVTIGFDGFIDSIVRVVTNRTAEKAEYFKTIREFGHYTLEKSGDNFSLELQKVVKKAGGNMPVMARAMAGWDVDINCIGTLGLPDIDALFREFPDNCKLFSFADPGVTTALEFNDGKIIMGEMSSLNSADWEVVSRVLGKQTLRDLFSGSSLIGIVNWSELLHATSIWKGLLEEVIPFISLDGKPVAFFDLADFSKRNKADLLAALDTLKQFKQYFRVVLGLNRNETRLLHEVLTGTSAGNQLTETGRKIYLDLQPEILLIHHKTMALAWHQEQVHIEECEVIEDPVISTGAGDNFNAGFAIAMMMNLDIAECLKLAHQFASHYMRTGSSLTVAEAPRTT